jgi:hypothetical protein
VVRNLKGRYLAVFVPHNWNGITGIPPVVIEVTDQSVFYRIICLPE